MNEDQQNEYIKVIERLNKKNIELRNNSLAVRNSRKNRLKEEITHLQFKKLFSHVLVRVRPKITTEQVENNLPKEMEDHLAKLGDQALRIAVYTCITGDYDSPESPFLQFTNIDYFLISDRVVAEGWTHIKLDESIIEKYGLSMSNRYVKFHPDMYFKDNYDYAIYIDGNITPVSDLSTFAELIDPRIGLAFHKHCSMHLGACHNEQSVNICSRWLTGIFFESIIHIIENRNDI